MLEAVFHFAALLLSLAGLMTGVYLILLLLMRPKRNYKSIIIIPAAADKYETAVRISYAAERLKPLSDREHAEIWVVESRETESSGLKKIYADYEFIRFVSSDKAPFILENYIDGEKS